MTPTSTVLAPISSQDALPVRVSRTSAAGDLVQYYSEAGPDFAAWSPQFNMHFGFYRRGLDPWNREAMLEQMNREVHDRLRLPSFGRHTVLDLGCGLGATARSMARRSPDVSVTGVTLVPWQVGQARRLTADAGLDDRVTFVEADYRALPWEDGSVDAACALESACHADGAGKSDFLAEAARVLKPGGWLVVADGFRKGATMNAIVRRCYETMCRCWKVEGCAEIGAFTRAARAAGFDQIRVEEISWRVAPSVAFVPLVSAGFLWRECVLRGGTLTRPRWENVLASLLGVVVGAARSTFGYYLVSARKAQG